MATHYFNLDVTTQGPLYPPSEVMDNDGNFIVIGNINREGQNGISSEWGSAIVSSESPVPAFGEKSPYRIIEEFDDTVLEHIGSKVLHTLPVPLPCNNYPMVFAPSQYPDANNDKRPSYAFHETPIPDFQQLYGRQVTMPITLEQWMKASGQLGISVADDSRSARFQFEFSNLIPRSMYTVMSLRARDLDPDGPTRPAPLGVPNVFISDADGVGSYDVVIPNPFPEGNCENCNRIVNVVVLWMSYQMSHGGAIGRYGLGGDIHAQLKFRCPMFHDFKTLA